MEIDLGFLSLMGGLMIGYWTGYFWRGINTPTELEDKVALIIMPSFGVIIILIDILFI